MALKINIPLIADRFVRLRDSKIEIQVEESVSVSFPDAYVRVEEVRADKSKQSANVACYTEKGGRLVWRKTFDGLPVETDGGNNIAQAYEALKTLPEFAGAADA
jgi:hypothetical protein